MLFLKQVAMIILTMEGKLSLEAKEVVEWDVHSLVVNPSVTQMPEGVSNATP